MRRDGISFETLVAVLAGQLTSKNFFRFANSCHVCDQVGDVRGEGAKSAWREYRAALSIATPH